MYKREIVAFLKVADSGSFSKAAKELFVSPVSIMNQINALEETIGVKLVERTSQGTSLTAAGRSVYQDSKKLIEHVDATIQRAKEIAVTEKNVIRIGTSILRPCKILVDLWAEFDEESLPFQIKIVPFDDQPSSMDSVISSFGKEIDCFVSPSDSIEWRQQCNILMMRHLPCSIAVPRKHRLAKKKMLTWADLDGENFMIIKRGDSPILNQMRDEIITEHPKINLIDAPNRYDTAIFNECEQMNYMMETLDIWTDVHPSLVTIPMEWHFEMPYGIIYAKEPTKVMEAFITKISEKIVQYKQMAASE